TPACSLSRVARGRGDERCPLWLIAIGIGCRRSGHHQSARLPDAQHGRGGVRILRKSAWTAPLPDRRAGRAALGYLQAALHRDGNARTPGYRCLVRSACHRMGLRVDHARSRLCQIPEVEVAGADATQRLATSPAPGAAASTALISARGRRSTAVRAQTFLRTLGIEITFSREGRAGSRIIRMHTTLENTV